MTNSTRVPWFVRQWRVPLNRCIYTAFSYMIFLFYIILYVAETSSTLLIDILTAIWIVSYTCRDLGTGTFVYILMRLYGKTLFFSYLHLWGFQNRLFSKCSYCAASKFLPNCNIRETMRKKKKEMGQRKDFPVVLKRICRRSSLFGIGCNRGKRKREKGIRLGEKDHL